MPPMSVATWVPGADLAARRRLDDAGRLDPRHAGKGAARRQTLERKCSSDRLRPDARTRIST